MVQRSPAQKKIDDRRFRVRIRFPTPPGGFRAALNELHAWLDQTYGRGNYAVLAHHGVGFEDFLELHLPTGAAAAEVERWINERMAKPICEY